LVADVFAARGFNGTTLLISAIVKSFNKRS
jgi:hypothetical protein